MKKLIGILIFIFLLINLSSCTIVTTGSGAAGNGILSIEKTSVLDNIDTYTIYFTNGSTTTFTVTNGKDGVEGIQGEPGIDGHTPVITIVDGYWYIDGVNTNVLALGVKGETGNGISSIEKTDTNGLVDTYTIYFTNGTTTTFTITNGKDGVEGIQGEPGIDGHTPAITIVDGYWYIDGVNTNISVTSKSKWDGKKAVFVGDSITNGVNTNKCYYDFLQEDIGFSEVNVMGVSGSCISSTSDYGNSNQPLSSRYKNIPSSDLIVIFMGTNDYGHETPLGNINDNTDVSFYGALNLVIDGLLTKHPTSTIVFVTPLHRYGFGTSKILNEKFTYDYLPNGRGHTLLDYRNAIIDTCQRWSVPVIDLYSISGINPSNSTSKEIYMPDGLHLNENGHKRIANIMINEIEDLFVGDIYESEQLDDKLQYGNKFVSSFTDHNRASSVVNIYLEAGQKVILKDNVKYNWALAGTNGPNSTVKTHGYYPQSAWSSVKEYTIEKSGYYGVLLMLIDGTEFDFENNPKSNSIYNYITIE